MLTRFFLALLTSTAALAQTATDASILGLVKDPSGAAIPGATVTVQNLETGLTRTAATGETGSFELLALPRGFYSVTVSKPQFLTWRLERIEITAGEQRRVTPSLQVGDVRQTV